MFKTYLRDSDSVFGSGVTENESVSNAKASYLDKYPEEKDINSIEFDTIEILEIN